MDKKVSFVTVCKRVRWSNLFTRLYSMISRVNYFKKLVFMYYGIVFYFCRKVVILGNFRREITILCLLHNKSIFSLTILDNLLNKLLHMIIGEKLLKNSIFNFAVHKKGWKSNFKEQNTFFPKRSSLRSQASEYQNIVFNPFQTCWDTL